MNKKDKRDLIIKKLAMFYRVSRDTFSDVRIRINKDRIVVYTPDPFNNWRDVFIFKNGRIKMIKAIRDKEDIGEPLLLPDCFS